MNTRAAGWRLGLAMAMLAATASAEEVTGVVIGERVNLRARPSLQAEVVGQVNEPDSVVIRSFSNEWAEVSPPESIEFCVHRDFVTNGVVQATKLTVRAGPGINYSRVGQLAKGDTVAVRGEFGEWLKIAPPPEASLWVSRDLVRLPSPRPSPVATHPTPPPSPPRPPSTDTGAPRPPPPPVVARPLPPPVAPPSAHLPAVTQDPASYTPTDLRLAPVDNQGAVVQREGRVRSTLMTLGRPSRYHLVDDTGGGSETLCYLRGNDAQLRTLTDRKLRIRGRQYWVQGHRYPVVVVDQIAPIPE